MPSSLAGAALRDILHHIGLATYFAAGFDPTTFHDDLRTVYAVTRCLEIISEASRRLPDELKARHPSIAWKRIAGAGNIYRHNTWRRALCGRRCNVTCRCCAPSSRTSLIDATATSSITSPN
jgi:hypothetical protein